jgi:hypothetical protein
VSCGPRIQPKGEDRRYKKSDSQGQEPGMIATYARKFLSSIFFVISNSH